MKEIHATEPLFEMERYELYEAPRYDFELTRRELLKLLGGGLIVVCLLSAADAQESGGRRGGPREGMPQEIGAWIHVGEDGVVTAYSGKVEVGQNARTSLTQAVADELGVPPASVTMVLGDTDLTPYDMGTFGSQTTPRMVPQMRRAAAAARETLVGLAAEQWKVDRSTLKVANGQVAETSGGRKVAFGQLTRGQKLVQAIGTDTKPKPAPDWTVAGKNVPKVNARAVVTGQHHYTSDVRLPGMLYGKILRPPTSSATFVTLNDTDARSVPGVLIVRDGDFVGVVAPNPYAAERALEALKPEWKTPDAKSIPDLYAHLRGARVESAIEPGASAAIALRQTYTIAYIAHVPLEPRAAVAEWKEGKLTVWTGTQRPFGVKSDLVAVFKLPPDHVRVIVPDTGAGYGGKHTGDAAVEAARLAKAAGKPVKLVWTREEEFTWAYVRPAGVIDVASRAGKDGVLASWEFHNYNSGGSGLRSPYEVAERTERAHPSDSPLRQGSYRGLAATANHFARESHMDELAHALNMDPFALRLKNLKDERIRAVLEAAAKEFGWDRWKPVPGRGVGLAAGTEKGSVVAACAEVSVDKATGRVKVERLTTAYECGAIVNPDHLRNQVEGASIMGLGGALFEAIELENDRILNPRLSKYRVPRFGDIPEMRTVLLDRKDLPSVGAGETPIVCVAPAVGNAIFNATGVRLRSMPMVPKGLKV